MNLSSRSAISVPSRYLNPVIPAKSKRVNKRMTNVLVHTFLTDTSIIYCGGKVGRGVNIQACVDPTSS